MEEEEEWGWSWLLMADCEDSNAGLKVWISSCKFLETL